MILVCLLQTRKNDGSKNSCFDRQNSARAEVSILVDMFDISAFFEFFFNISVALWARFAVSEKCQGYSTCESHRPEVVLFLSTTQCKVRYRNFSYFHCFTSFFDILRNCNSKFNSSVQLVYT